MGLFERLGREVGEFTHAAKEAAEENADYECTACGERLHADRDACPECGADAVEAVETDAGDDDVSEAADVDADETDVNETEGTETEGTEDDETSASSGS